MKKLIVTILVIALILLGTTLALNGMTNANAQKEHLEKMHTSLPGSSEFTLEPYSGEDANIRSVHKAENGFVIETATYGYAGEITVLIGVSNEGKVTGLVVRDLKETYGLGANALTDVDFPAQFLNGSGEFTVATHGADAFSEATGTETSDGATEVDALTGATVTSKAVVRCINSALAYVTGADIDTSATSWGG